MLCLPAWGEEDVDTVARLGVTYGAAKLSTLEQAQNAILITRPGLILQPALDFAILPYWMITLESEHRLMRFEAPSGVTLLQDAALTSSVTAGLHLVTSTVEFGAVAGLGQNTFVGATPNTSYITLQSLAMPYVGGRIAYNGRWKNFYMRWEGLFLNDFETRADRGSLAVTTSRRVVINSHWGFADWWDWLRLTAGVSIHQAETTFGAQNSIVLGFGLSIGNIWGTRAPRTR